MIIQQIVLNKDTILYLTGLDPIKQEITFRTNHYPKLSETERFQIDSTPTGVFLFTKLYRIPMGYIEKWARENESI